MPSCLRSRVLGPSAFFRPGEDPDTAVQRKGRSEGATRWVYKRALYHRPETPFDRNACEAGKTAAYPRLLAVRHGKD
jgi:hypothetical protein